MDGWGWLGGWVNGWAGGGFGWSHRWAELPEPSYLIREAGFLTWFWLFLGSL